MSANMKELHAQMVALVAANRAHPEAALLMERAARVVSDANALVESTLRELHVWAGQPPSVQWTSTRLDQPVAYPDLPPMPKAMEPMFAPLEPGAVQSRAFTFRQLS